MIRGWYPWRGNSSPLFAPPFRSQLLPLTPVVLFLCPWGRFRTTTSVCTIYICTSFAHTSTLVLAERKRETKRVGGRENPLGIVSIMGWNTKRMQTWNNTTLDRAFRAWDVPSFILFLLSLLISRFQRYLTHTLLPPCSLCSIPKDPRGTWNFRQCNEPGARRKRPNIIFEPRGQSFFRCRYDSTRIKFTLQFASDRDTYIRQHTYFFKCFRYVWPKSVDINFKLYCIIY